VPVTIVSFEIKPILVDNRIISIVPSTSGPARRNTSMNISSDQAIAELIQAKSDSTQQKVAFKVAAKQLDAQKFQGDAIVSLLEQAVTVQKQLDAGHLDVQV
jgi:hypothetical protein